MNKSLCIQIDNNSLPEGCGEDVEVLDCRCINDFCSLVGDALVGDLKDENGKPFYRLINPVGKLLMDFKTVDEKAFDSIIDNWYDILGNLLHKGMQEDDIVIKFPQQYVDWLLHNDNPYYEQVGKELQRQNGKITLSTEAIDDDIIASINYKVSHKLQEKKDDFSFAVFSNPIIRNSSFVVKRVRLEGIEFMRYDSWNGISVNEKSPQLANVLKNLESNDIFTINGISFKMIRVEGGTFTMGAIGNEGSDYEKPAHYVTLSSYYIAETEVTQALWQAVMGSNPSYFKGDNCPVECVSWADCQMFIGKLQMLTGKNFRLPTEAEWEFAARGGIKNMGYKFSGSNNLDAVAWYKGNSWNKTHPVKQKLPNELGIYDMSGNVLEWCQDCAGKYNSSTQTNPTGPSSAAYYIRRGGAYIFDGGLSFGVSWRDSGWPSSRDSYVGFRLAL